MTSDEDKIRFHNGDTLESIPVVRIDEPERRRIPWRTVGGVLGAALLVGGLFGLSFALGEGEPTPTAAAPDDETGPTAPVSAAPSPEPVPTVTVTRTPTPTVTVTEQASEAVPAPYVEPVAMEYVYVISAPFTGGDPGTNYCVSYTGSSNGDGALAVLQAEVPAYQCHDFLFSTHPDDQMGVFETTPPDCSDTEGGRTAQILFDPMTGWGDGVLYTCLLANNGA